MTQTDFNNGNFPLVFKLEDVLNTDGNVALTLLTKRFLLTNLKLNFDSTLGHNVINEGKVIEFYHDVPYGFITKYSRVCSDNTWNKFKPTIKPINIITSPFYLIHPQLYDRISDAIKDFPCRTQGRIMRVFCYIYAMDAYYNGIFQRSQTMMATELKMGKPNLHDALSFLVIKGFIRRTGNYHFGEGNAYSYHWSIPNKYRYTLENYYSFLSFEIL